MQRKKIRKTVWLCLSLLLLFPGEKIQAAQIGQIQKEIQYTTLDAGEKKSFEKSITKDGREYLLEDVSYEVLSKNPVKQKEKVTLTKVSKPVKKNRFYQPEEKIEQDGVTYELETVSEKSKVIKKKSTQTVSAFSIYDASSDALKAPSQKTVTVKDKVTGKNRSVVCTKTKTKKTGEVWVDSYIDILFSGYDADNFIWNNLTVKKNAKNPLKGYDKQLLQSVGGNTDNYKVKSVSWNGKSYKKNGTLYRKARASVRKKVPRYRVSYTGSIQHKEEKAIVYSCLYQGVKETETKEASYIIAAKASYVAKDEGVSPLVITVAVVLVLAAVVGILFLVLKKRNSGKSKEGGKHYGKIGNKHS